MQHPHADLGDVGAHIAKCLWWYLDHLTNYGSLFLGEWSTVAYADKGMSGTNHYNIEFFKHGLQN